MSWFVLPVAGGLLMGLASGLFLIVSGRLAGVSGLVASLVGPDHTDADWRLAFVLGLVGGGAVLAAAYPAAIPVETPSVARMLAGGVLVGVGARVAGGCTSGHGLLGVGRLSRRSLVATVVFMGTAMITIAALRAWTGGY